MLLYQARSVSQMAINSVHQIEIMQYFERSAREIGIKGWFQT